MSQERMVKRYSKPEPTVRQIASSPELTQASPSAVSCWASPEVLLFLWAVAESSAAGAGGNAAHRSRQGRWRKLGGKRFEERDQFELGEVSTLSLADRNRWRDLAISR